MQVRDVIDLAARRAGSQSALAAALRVSEQRLSNIKSGAECSEEMHLRLAEAAGLPEPTLARYILGIVRRKAGKAVASLAGVAVMLATFGAAEPARAADANRADV